jgi:hypothetical protein
MKIILSVVVCFCVCFLTNYSYGFLDSSLSPRIQNTGQRIVLQNRILVTINDKNISLLDVVKRMDMFIGQHSSSQTMSTLHRFQYYMSQWRDTLQRMINDELMLMDAKQCRITVSDGEVREELQNRFGPNVVASLEAMGISYEEAREWIYQEMVVLRIYWMRVQAKSLQKITPNELKRLYAKYLEKNPTREELQYQVLTIVAKDFALSRWIGDEIINLREETFPDLLRACNLLKERGVLDKDVSIAVSQDLSINLKDLSTSYARVLNKLEKNTWSEPVAFTSREGVFITRIFHLKNRIITPPPSFVLMEQKLKDAVYEQIVSKEVEKYVKKLRQRFNFEDSLIDVPDSFEPFSIT